MKKAVCPGSFDPITKGHEDVVLRAAKIFDEVIVLVMNNTSKSYMFSAEKRYEMAKVAFEGKTNVKVVLFGGMLCDYVKEEKIDCIVKGVRNSIDFSYEYELFAINEKLEGCETFLVPSDPQKSFISSAFVRELILYGKSFAEYLPNGVEKNLKKF